MLLKERSKQKKGIRVKSKIQSFVRAVYTEGRNNKVEKPNKFYGEEGKIGSISPGVNSKLQDK